MTMPGFDYSFEALTAHNAAKAKVAAEQARQMYEAHYRKVVEEEELRKCSLNGQDVIDAEYEVIEPLKLDHKPA